MKPCKRCAYHIPEQARHCPHCRARTRRGDWLPQLVWALIAAGAAGAFLLEGCPGALL